MCKFETIYCVEKTTDFERAKKNEVFPNDLSSNLLKERRIQNHENHRIFMDDFLNKLQKVFPKIIPVKDVNMKTIQPNKNDLVISCGGDGTFLACAQDYFDATLLGVNTNYLPKDPIFGSFGALTSINKKDIDKRIEQLNSEKYQQKKWRRLSAKVDKQPTNSYAVNDIFVGRKISYKTSYFSFQSSKHYGEFFCSGVISCTGVGSHSWYRNAGGTPFGRSLDSFAYLVLSPHVKSFLTEHSEILAGQESIKIYSLKNDVVLVFDSRESIKVKANQEIEIFLDQKKPIQVINFSPS